MNSDFLSFFQNSNITVTFLGIISFVVAIPFFIISLFQNDESKNCLKIAGAFIVISLSCFANEPIVYALAIFIIATFITKLDFLENIAAIFWGREEFWRYRASLSKATPEEIQRKIDNEIREEPKLRKKSDTIAAVRANVLKFETNAIDALKKSNLFQEYYVTTQDRLRIGRRIRHMIDAVVHTPRSDYIVEVKASSSKEIIENAVDQIQKYMRAYIVFKLETPNVPSVKGIIIIPTDVSVGNFVRGIAILKFEPNASIFTNLEVIKRWILEEIKMVQLGIYRTKDGKEYDCLLFPDDAIAEAVGPLPEPGQIGSRGPAFKVIAESEQDARRKLAKEIGSGKFV